MNGRGYLELQEDGKAAVIGLGERPSRALKTGAMNPHAV